MPPVKAAIEVAEAILASPAVKATAESAIRAGAHLIEEFFATGAKSAAKAAIGTAEKTAGSAATSGLTKSAESLLTNPKNDLAVTSLINAIESPLQSAAAKSAKQLGIPFTEAHRTAMTELAQDRVLSSRLSLLSGELKPASVVDFERHLQKSVSTDFKSAFAKFLPGRSEAAENAGLLRGAAVDPLEAAVAQDRRRVVESAMNTLTPRRNEAIQQRFFDNVSRSQTGQNMGITDSGVTQLEEKGLRSLKWPVLQSLRP